MAEWYFPSAKNLSKQSVNDAGIETFKDNIVESLAREICQNSVDASADPDKPVVVSFEKSKISKRKIFDSLEKNISLAENTWHDDENALKYLEEFSKIIHKNKIEVLKISDYNTTGLEKANWNSLVLSSGTSKKQNKSSGGSFGIGKSAAFASSDIRMVFYSTKTINGEEKSIGVIQFISCDLEVNGTIETSQPTGYYGKFENKAFDFMADFGFKERQEPGTDIYIISFTQKNWQERLIDSVLENFMLTIHNGDLEVMVQGERINKDNLGVWIEQINNYEGRKKPIKPIRKRRDRIKKYYSVLVDPKTKVFKLDERFEKYNLKADEAVLKLNLTEDANRTVYMTRLLGMKVFDKNRIHGSIQFNGIFQARGKRLNEILRQMENPAHNKWESSRYEKNTKMAEELRLDIGRFIKDKVKTEFQLTDQEEIDVIGLEEFLPNVVKNSKHRLGNTETHIIPKIKSAEIKSHQQKKSVKQDDKGKEVRDDWGIGEQIKDELGTDEGGISRGKDNNSSGRDIETTTEDKGNKRSVSNPNGHTINQYRSFTRIHEKVMRIYENNYKEGLYRFMIKPSHDMAHLRVNLNLVGETGYSYKAKINEAIDGEKYLDIRKNQFYIEDLKQDEVKFIQLRLPYDMRLRMEVKLYESK